MDEGCQLVVQCPSLVVVQEASAALFTILQVEASLALVMLVAISLEAVTPGIATLEATSMETSKEVVADGVIPERPVGVVVVVGKTCPCCYK